MCLSVFGHPKMIVVAPRQAKSLMNKTECWLHRECAKQLSVNREIGFIPSLFQVCGDSSWSGLIKLVGDSFPICHICIGGRSYTHPPHFYTKIITRNPCLVIRYRRSPSLKTFFYSLNLAQHKHTQFKGRVVQRVRYNKDTGLNVHNPQL